MASKEQKREAGKFVDWFTARHLELLGKPVRSENRERSIKAAELMLDKMSFADAGGRALFFLQAWRFEPAGMRVSTFCLRVADDVAGIHAYYERTQRLDRIIRINCDLRSVSKWYVPPVDHVNTTVREHAEPYSIAELSHLAKHLLDQYGTREAIPEGVKQRLETAGRL